MFHYSGQSHFNLMFKQECHKPPQMLLFLWLSRIQSHPSRAWSSWGAGTLFPCERAVTCAAFSEDTGTGICQPCGRRQSRYTPTLPGKLFSGIPTGERLLLLYFFLNFSKYNPWVWLSIEASSAVSPFFWWVVVSYFYYLVIKKKKKNYEEKLSYWFKQSVSVPRPK